MQFERLAASGNDPCANCCPHNQRTCSSPKAKPLDMKIAVIGLGYVGLPLSLQFARSGTVVLGLDVDSSKVDAINAGRSYIKHVESSAIQALIAAEHFSASTDFTRIKETTAVIICVPTPLNKNREPD